MAKKKRGLKKTAIRKVGKITFLYFSGDVGEFIDALTGTLKDPKVRSQIVDAISQVGPAVEVMQAEAAKASASKSRRAGAPR